MITLLILTVVGIVAAVALSAVVNPCDLTVLTQQSKCFNCLSKSEKQALKVWFYLQALKALGAEDLTNPDDLYKAVKCFVCESTFALESFDVAVAQNLAVGAGFAEAGTMTISELRAAIKCLVCTDAKMLKAAETGALCGLVAFIGGPPIL